MKNLNKSYLCTTCIYIEYLYYKIYCIIYDYILFLNNKRKKYVSLDPCYNLVQTSLSTSTVYYYACSSQKTFVQYFEK